MRLPAKTASRSRRMVSTSGSSGTRGLPPRVPLAAGNGGIVRPARTFPIEVGVQLTAEARPGHAGGRLLRLLLGPAVATAAYLSPHQDQGIEQLGVIGALVGHLVLGEDVEAPG